MRQLSIASGVPALLVAGSEDEPVSTLIQNVDPANTIWLGSTIEVSSTNPLHGVPLIPGASTVVDGTENLFGVAAQGQVVQINVMPGATSFFQPTNLATLGGASIYVQASAPTPPIAPNSLWFAPNGSIQVWNGTSWQSQTFSGQQIITANTIYAAQLAAGIVYAGIVDGTIVKAATFIGGLSLWYSSANPARGTLVASAGATAQTTDPQGNLVMPGHCSYQPVAGSGTPSYLSQHWNSQFNVGAASAFTNPNNSPGQMSMLLPAQLTVDSGSIGASDTSGTVSLRSGSATGLNIPMAVFEGTALAPTPSNTTPNASAGPLIYANQANSALTYLTAGGLYGIIPATQSDFTTFVNATTSMNRLTFLWPIPAADYYNSVVYHLRAWGHGVQGSTQQQLNTQMSGFGLTFAGNNMPATDIPASASFHWRYDIDIVINTGGNNIIYGGSFTWSQAAVTANRGTAAIDGNISPLPSGNTNLAIQMGWNSIAGTTAPTITGAGSVLSREAA